VVSKGGGQGEDAKVHPSSSGRSWKGRKEIASTGKKTDRPIVSSIETGDPRILNHEQELKGERPRKLTLKSQRRKIFLRNEEGKDSNKKGRNTPSRFELQTYFSDGGASKGQKRLPVF